jgi:hypothetical protein
MQQPLFVVLVVLVVFVVLAERSRPTAAMALGQEAR